MEPPSLALYMIVMCNQLGHWRLLAISPATSVHICPMLDVVHPSHLSSASSVLSSASSVLSSASSVLSSASSVLSSASSVLSSASSVLSSASSVLSSASSVLSSASSVLSSVSSVLSWWFSYYAGKYQAFVINHCIMAGQTSGNNRKH